MLMFDLSIMTTLNLDVPVTMMPMEQFFVLRPPPTNSTTHRAHPNHTMVITTAGSFIGHSAALTLLLALITVAAVLAAGAVYLIFCMKDNTNTDSKDRMGKSLAAQSQKVPPLKEQDNLPVAAAAPNMPVKDIPQPSKNINPRSNILKPKTMANLFGASANKAFSKKKGGSGAGGNKSKLAKKYRPKSVSIGGKSDKNKSTRSQGISSKLAKSKNNKSSNKSSNKRSKTQGASSKKMHSGV